MPPFVVSPAAPHELLPACRLLFSDGRAEYSRDRILTDTHTTGLFVARWGGKLHAAALVQALPGALGVAWAPRGDSAEAIDAVTDAACAWLRGRGVKVCQAFAAAGEAADVLPLERAGFRYTTQLVFMRGEPPRVRSDAEPEQRLTFWFRAPPLIKDLEDTLLATHRGSLDCPELNASRTDVELMQGFASATTAEWYYATRGDERVGLAIVEAGTGGALELTYLGVVPAARGRGFGAELLQFLLASVAHSSALNVSVDARNTPAVALYARHGFAEYDRRAVWLLAPRA